MTDLSEILVLAGGVSFEPGQVGTIRVVGKRRASGRIVYTLENRHGEQRDLVTPDRALRFGDPFTEFRIGDELDVEVGVTIENGVPLATATLRPKGKG